MRAYPSCRRFVGRPLTERQSARTRIPMADWFVFFCAFFWRRSENRSTPTPSPPPPPSSTPWPKRKSKRKFFRFLRGTRDGDTRFHFAPPMDRLAMGHGPIRDPILPAKGKTEGLGANRGRYCAGCCWNNRGRVTQQQGRRTICQRRFQSLIQWLPGNQGKC